MNKLKKIIRLLMLSLVCFITTGCDPATTNFQKDVFIDKIEKIELRKTNKTEYQDLIDTNNGEKPTFDYDDTVLIEELDNRKNNDFCTALSIITFHQSTRCAMKPVGYVLVISLSDDTMVVLSSTNFDDNYSSIFALFKDNGEFIQVFGEFAAQEAYERLLTKYFKNYDENKSLSNTIYSNYRYL